MSALAALQRDFMRALFEEGEPAAPGLAVYRASVLANFAGALDSTYPVVRRLVGDAFFAEAARQYARAHPSASGDLGDYGEGFARFLAAYPHAAALAYLPDVARLEWACHECERSPEAPPFDFEALARVAPEADGGLRLLLHPAVRLIESAHPVAAIHEANAPGRDGTPRRTDGPDFVLVRRIDSGAHVEAVTPHEWRFLDRLARGETLESASRGAPRLFLEGATARYVAEGVVCGFTAPRCAP
jgi:hypothetical protein